MKNNNMILTEKQQKYLQKIDKHEIDIYEKLINMNILQVKKYCLQVNTK